MQEKIDKRNDLLQKAKNITSSPIMGPSNPNSISNNNNVSNNNSNISIDRKISKVENSPMTPKTKETVRPPIVPQIPVSKPEFDLEFSIPDMDNDAPSVNDQDEDMVYNENNVPQQDNNMNALDKNASEFFSKLPDQSSMFPSKSNSTTTNSSTPNQSTNKNTTSSLNSNRPSIIDFFP